MSHSYARWFEITSRDLAAFLTNEMLALKTHQVGCCMVMNY